MVSFTRIALKFTFVSICILVNNGTNNLKGNMSNVDEDPSFDIEDDIVVNKATPEVSKRAKMFTG